jgi:hypothetical protein
LRLFLRKEPVLDFLKISSENTIFEANFLLVKNISKRENGKDVGRVVCPRAIFYKLNEYRLCWVRWD